MIPSNPPTTTSSAPVEPPSAPEVISAATARSSELPPVKGSLPYTKQDYEQLPPYEKTPALDFLILGKIPGGKYQAADSYPLWDQEFNSTVLYCLHRGETAALDFLWRESGRDPAKTLLDLTRMSMDNETVATLVQHGSNHRSLKLDLSLRGQHADVMSEVSRLIAEGHVNSLLLDTLSADQLEAMAPILGKVGAQLFIYNSPISDRCEQEFAESLGKSSHLAALTLGHCGFGDSQGKHFVEGLRKNRSIIMLQMSGTPLLTTPESGYRTLLTDNPTLQTLTVIKGLLDPQPDIDAIISGLMNNHALRELRVRASGYVQDNPEKLCRLLETNRTLKELVLTTGLQSDEAFKAVTVSLAKNTSLITFAVKDAGALSDDLLDTIEDLMARNEALANDPSYLQKAGRAFDPSGTSGLGDPAALIAQHAFALSPTRSEFEAVMTEVELSLREQERLVIGAGTQPAVTTTTTTDAATITTATTTTTTTTATITTTPPSGSSSD